MNIGSLQFNDANKIAQSAVESQSGNAAHTPDLDRNTEAFKHAMGFKPEGQDSSGPGIVVVDSNHNEPTLYLDSAESTLGSAAPSPFSVIGNITSLATGGIGPSIEGVDSVLGSGAASSFSPEITNLDTGGIGPAVPQGGYTFDE